MKILGLSAYYHDSAACLLLDQRPAFASQEDRFTRVKGDERFPIEAIKFCLEASKNNLQDLDAIVYYEKPWLTFERLIESYVHFAPKGISSFLLSMPQWLNYKLNLKSQIKKELTKNFCRSSRKLPPLLFSSHHLSHAASAFFPSPFDEAAVLCLDGVGEWSTVSAWDGRGQKLKPLWEIKFPHSIGLLYSAITAYCGFKINSGEYKLMGLAPFGKPKYQDLLEKEIIHILENGSFRMNMKYFEYAYGLQMFHKNFNKLIGFGPRLPEQNMDQCYMDLAASVQAITEKIMLRLAQTIKKETGHKNLSLAGGVSLNCVGNGKISSQQIFENTFIQPAAGDAGGALGAALAVAHMHFNQPRETQAPDLLNGSLLGPEFKDDQIELLLKQENLNFLKLSTERLLQKTAHMLDQQMIVGWFQGRAEFGPRALGNRSILGDARNPDMKSIMNMKIKFREGFRPFAPAVLAENAKDIFDLKELNPYMLLVGPCLSEKKYPSISHIDGSSRVQTVDSNSNHLFYQLLKTFEKTTGCPLLINTSFNVRGEPIVNTPKNALDCFYNTDIDALAIGSFLVTKKDNAQIKKNINWSNNFARD
jgi:carbamoyltransferase